MQLHPLDQITLVVVFILGLAAAIILIAKRLKATKQNLFKFIIIGKENNFHKDEKVDLYVDKLSIKFNGNQYEGFKNRAFMKTKGFLDRQLSGINREYWMIFTEKTDKGKDPPVQVKPPDVTTPVKDKNGDSYLMATSSLLYKVYKYRGADRAFKDEFKESREFDFPVWAIMIVVLVLVALAVFAAEYLGWIDFVPTIGKVAKGAVQP